MKRTILLSFSVLVAACGMPATNDDVGGTTEQEVTGPSSTSSTPTASTTTAPTKVENFYYVRPDYRKCPSPMCGGWWIRGVNDVSKEEYVASFDWSASGLDAKTIGSVQAANPDEIILKGAVIPGTYNDLLVTEAYLGLPGAKPASSIVYSVTVMPYDCAACATLRANVVNTSKYDMAWNLSVKAALQPYVQADWVEDRVLSHGALITASISSVSSSVTGPTTLFASQVWLRLPDKAGPCASNTAKPAPCPVSGTVQTFRRDVNRCIVADQCAKPQACPLTFAMPSCSPGYRIVSWVAAPDACDAYACDPEFVSP